MEVISPQVIFADRSGKAEIRASGQGIGGYLWSAKVVAGSCAVDQAYLVPGPGIGGGSLVVFSVVNVGMDGCKIELSYVRPWENKPIKEAIIEVRKS